MGVLGTNRVPVKLPTILANLPGLGPQRSYLLAIDQLQPGQLDKIVAHLSTKFSMTEEETQDELAKAGIPILDRDCTLSIYNPQRWVD